MKKYIITMAFVLALAGSTSAADLSVISPVAGAQWQAGKWVTVTWSGTAGDVYRADLFDAVRNRRVATIFADYEPANILTVKTFSKTWFVPRSLITTLGSRVATVRICNESTDTCVRSGPITVRRLISYMPPVTVTPPVNSNPNPSINACRPVWSSCSCSWECRDSAPGASCSQVCAMTPEAAIKPSCGYVAGRCGLPLD
jgi:hypothetical protein